VKPIAKGHARTNRDDDISYFVAYYKKPEFYGTKFKQFKQLEHHDKFILALLVDIKKREQVKSYIKN
jgi:hypothetical protein